MENSLSGRLDVSSLSIKSAFNPPTNQASKTNCQQQYEHMASDVMLPTKFFGIPSLSTVFCHSPWLPASKGDIKKLAQTRFVNSSPKSYRLMPASVESSESDRTSFVEKAFHKFLLPVSYFLEVAKLWELSNRSELECTFTLAKTENVKTTSSLQTTLEDDKCRPICHSKAISQNLSSKDFPLSDKSNAESELLQSVNRFLQSCLKRDKSFCFNQGISDISNDVGSETRRYLSQIVSLMNKKFAIKLQNGLHKQPECIESRKRPISSVEESSRKRMKETSRVNVFTMLSAEQDESDKEQFLIIHIPTSPKKCKNMRKSIIGTPSPDDEDSTSTEKQHKCFYCPLLFDDKTTCARHMLSHLTSDINGGPMAKS